MRDNHVGGASIHSQFPQLTCRVAEEETPDKSHFLASANTHNQLLARN